MPRPFKRSSIRKADPIKPPINNEPSTTKIGQPSPTASTKSAFHIAEAAPAAAKKETNPSASVTSVRVLSGIRLPIRVPKAVPIKIATTFINVPIIRTSP